MTIMPLSGEWQLPVGRLARSYEPLESCSGRHTAKDGSGTLPEAYDYWNYLKCELLAYRCRNDERYGSCDGRDAEKYEAMAASSETVYIG